MLNELRERAGNPIRVGLVGAGAMGLGVAYQVAKTPGMELAFIADLDLEAARRAAQAAGGAAEIAIGEDAMSLLAAEGGAEIDVLVESSTAIGPAARYALAAIERGAHVVLMNAEVDLALGPLLSAAAERAGVVVTSDAGDQHGVLARMIEEIELWGFGIVQAGNMKGYLRRHALAHELEQEAAARHLDLVQCCACTDGTKMNIEMALLSNATGLVALVDGMEGPRCADVSEVPGLFDFAAYGDQGRVDYVLGAEPGGGVYVVGHCDDSLQAQYLRYYKMGEPPYYLFYRPYHLCHIETPRAIAMAALHGRAVMRPVRGRVSDVYAYAKQDLAAGRVVEHGIGGDECYGMIRTCRGADAEQGVPIAALEGAAGAKPRLLREVPADRALVHADIEIPDSELARLLREQEALLR